MKKYLVSVAMSMMSLAMAFGHDTRSSVSNTKPVQQDREKAIAEQGGMILVGGNGSITVIDTLDIEESRNLLPKAFKMARILHVFIEAKRGVFSFKTAADSVDVDNAVVFIVDDPVLPITLVAQEARWAVVNLSSLKGDNIAKGIVDDRLYKSFLRATCLLLGAAPCKFPASPLKPVMSLKALDALKDTTLTFDAVMNMDSYMKGIGIKRYEPMTYQAACEEGVAPAPTNDVQKAIWEKVQAEKERGPTNPITIPPPGKVK